MRRKASTAAAPSSLPPRAARGEGAPCGFSLVELLVVISIILVLMALMGAAVSAVRSSGSKIKTETMIAAIDAIIQGHFRRIESSRAGAGQPPAQRSETLRRLATADMPDSWVEVKYMKARPQEFSQPRQRGYVATLNAISEVNASFPTDEYADAECLFMMIMQGGLADCVACSTVDMVRIGDKDEDGAFEFWDAWDMPIRYVLWPGGFEQPPGTRYFSDAVPFSGGATTAEAADSMRPLIFSAGPSKLASTAMHDGSYLSLGGMCGNPTDPTIATLGGLASGSTKDERGDNITNFGREKR